VYIKPLSEDLKPEDIEYLAKKGALTIPDDEFQRELIRTYLQYIHPLMPVLDLMAFLNPVTRRDGSVVSLLIFQAVTFASVAFVDLEYLTVRGYSSRRAARSIFFDRVRLLYDLNCETDRIAILQALLLMTYWYERPEDEKETWHWTGIALSQAQIQGIHRNPDGFNITPAMKSLRKRIWWSLFVRDRLLALGIRRPARVRPGDFDVPMLTLEDCEMEPFDDCVQSFLAPMPSAQDPPRSVKIYSCFLELAKLCVHIGDILFTQYTILSNPSCGTEENIALMVMPQESDEQRQAMEEIDLKLEDWQRSLDPGCRYIVGQSHTAESYRVLSLHQAMLHMMYLTAMAILHRPRALASGSTLTDSEVPVRLSKDKVTFAAAGITEVVHDLYHDNQLRFASTSTIPALISATLIHLIDIPSSRDEVRYACIGRFYQCWQALQYLRDMYGSAEHALWFLEAVIQKAKVDIPMFMLKPRIERFPTKLGDAPYDSPGREPAGTSAMAANSLLYENRYALTAAGNSNVVDQVRGNSTQASLPNAQSAFALGHLTPGSFPESSFAHMQMDEAMPGHLPHEGWNGFDTEDNILAELVRFNADPYFVLYPFG
jgi:hypothetical protein